MALTSTRPVSNPVEFAVATADTTPPLLSVRVAAETYDRLQINANGVYSGDGTAAPVLRAGTASTFTSVDATVIGIGTTTRTAATGLNLVSGTTAASGIAFGIDTDLYRGGPDILKTDDRLDAGLEINARIGAATQVQLGSVGGVAGISFGTTGTTTLTRTATGRLGISGDSTGDWTLTGGSQLDLLGAADPNCKLRFEVNTSSGVGAIQATKAGTGNQTLRLNPAGGAVQVGSGGLTIVDASDVVLDTTTGTKIGTAAAQKLGFHNATPVIQRAGAAQAAVITTAATLTTPYGYATQAQADAIVTLVNEIRAALVEKGLIKGAA